MVSSADSNMTIDIGDLYSAVVRRWRLLVPALALSASLAGVYILITPARYAATMSFLVDTRERPPIGVDAQPIAQNPDTGLIESQMRLLTSNEVLRRLIADEQLRVDPEFAPGKPGIFARLKSLVGMAAPKSDATIDGIVENLGKTITTKRNEKSYVIDVEVRASSPEKAERLARGLANAYYETQTKMGDDIADREIDWLDKKIADLRTRLQQSEQRLEDYRKTHSIIMTDGHTPLEQQLKDANSALVDARGKRAELEARYAQIQAAIRAGGSIENVDEAIKSPLIEKLRGEYATLSRDAAYAESTLGPRHPSYTIIKAQLSSLRAQIKAELGRISAAGANDLKTARNTERLAEQIVANLETSINNTGGDRLEYNELERQTAAVRERYEKALAARENVHREVVSSPNGVLIDQPTALKSKVSPKTLPALIIALAASLNIWIAAALILEFRERKRTASTNDADRPQQSTKESPSDSSQGAVGQRKAPPADRTALERTAPALESRWKALDSQEPAAVIVALPALVAGGDSANTRETKARALVSGVRITMQSPRAPYRQAIEKIYDALWSGGVASPTPIVAIGASAEGAGVSTVALSLSFMACAQGDRVLLIDCSAKRPNITPLLANLRRVKLRFGFESALYNFHKDRNSGGEVLMATFEQGWPREPYFKSKFDLILLDCGALLEQNQNPPPAEEIDALVMVESTAQNERQACILFGRNRADAKVRRQSGPVRVENRMRA